jgi:toxin ParE1/3/4
MAKVQLSTAARADYDEIMEYLRTAGGQAVVDQYQSDFFAAFDQIEVFPGSGAPRGHLGASVRLLVLKPYSIYYEGRPKGDAVLVLRILRGRRRVTKKVLAEGRQG